MLTFNFLHCHQSQSFFFFGSLKEPQKGSTTIVALFWREINQLRWIFFIKLNFFWRLVQQTIWLSINLIRRNRLFGNEWKIFIVSPIEHELITIIGLFNCEIKGAREFLRTYIKTDRQLSSGNFVLVIRFAELEIVDEVVGFLSSSPDRDACKSNSFVSLDKSDESGGKKTLRKIDKFWVELPRDWIIYQMSDSKLHKKIANCSSVAKFECSN